MKKLPTFGSFVNESSDEDKYNELQSQMDGIYKK